jgi:hypothetical protein
MPKYSFLTFHSNAWAYGLALRLHITNYKIITCFQKFNSRIFKTGYEERVFGRVSEAK